MLEWSGPVQLGMVEEPAPNCRIAWIMNTEGERPPGCGRSYRGTSRRGCCVADGGGAGRDSTAGVDSTVILAQPLWPRRETARALTRWRRDLGWHPRLGQDHRQTLLMTSPAARRSEEDIRWRRLDLDRRLVGLDPRIGWPVLTSAPSGTSQATSTPSSMFMPSFGIANRVTTASSSPPPATGPSPRGRPA
jgi:hypothetical protein